MEWNGNKNLYKKKAIHKQSLKRGVLEVDLMECVKKNVDVLVHC